MPGRCALPTKRSAWKNLSSQHLVKILLPVCRFLVSLRAGALPCAVAGDVQARFKPAGTFSYELIQP